MSLNFISGSSYLMLRGAVIITTALFSKILFDMKIERRHYIGCASSIVGLIVVGGAGFINSEGTDSK